MAREIGAVHIRIDSIEQAIRESGVVVVSLDDAGYRVGYAIAADNLALGHMVIADSVNPLLVTRDAWAAVAHRTHVPALEVEFICSDAEEHRRRIETRTSDIPGLKSPSWPDVVAREYDPWNREHTVIDTAHRSLEEALKALRAAIGGAGR